MDRREQTERAEAVDDPTSEPDRTETGGPSGEGTVAQRLNRVARYASSGAKSHPPEPAADPDPEEQQAAGTEGHEPHEPAPAPAEQHRPAPADEALYEPAPAEAAMAQAPTAMPEAPHHRPVAQDARPETAPAEETAQGAQPFDDPQPDVPAPEEITEALAALADPEPEPAAAPPPAPAEEPQEMQDVYAEAHHTALEEEIQPAAPAESAPGPDPVSGEPPAASPVPPPEDSEKLTVGRGIRLVAKLCECTELLVEGHLEATARVRHLTVAEGGRFIGSAETDSAEVHGHFEGNLTVANRLFISATGRVAGTTCYQEIVIEAGGQVMGNAQRLPEHPEPGNGEA